jgi:hypothetical protein
MIVGAADRMITARNTEFEVPSLSKERANAPVLKVVPLNKHVVAMISGDAGFQSQALQHLWQKLAESRKAEANAFVSSVKINEIGQHYTEFCNAKMRSATDNLLAPYGLTTESFLEKQRSLSNDFVELMVSEIEKIRRNTGSDIIFCGIDETGCHVLICNGSDSSTADSFGFAAIGSGSEHAESQFMLAEHCRDDCLEDTILLSYIAKKRSEVSPGVGTQTDMFAIPPTGVYFLTHDNISRLQSIYETMEKSQAKSFKQAKEKVRKYVAELREQLKRAQEELPPTKEVLKQGD